MMKKLTIGALLVAMAVVMAAPAQAAFTVGGENGWSLSTDGIVNVFGTYAMTEKNPAGGFTLLNSNPDATAHQEFGVRVGLLPSIIALNVKAPTVAGIDSNVRVGIYPSVQHSHDYRFETAPNVDWREFFYTASGKFGQLLAGRALNLFQGQNILNDMTLFTAGVITDPRTTTTLGHIAYGYLYTNFSPQFRYTTPDMNGVKVALEIGEPYDVSDTSAKQNVPRFEAEVSYATKFNNGSIHAWVAGLWQQDTRQQVVSVPTDGSVLNPRGGHHNQSLGVAPGFNLMYGPVGVSASGYYGRGLGIVSAQDGNVFGQASVDALGVERKHWGFLAGVTYQVTDAIRLGANYGRCDVSADDSIPAVVTDIDAGEPVLAPLKKTQEAAVAQINYNLNKFTQFTLEYIWARDSWYGVDNKMTSHQIALGTVFFW